MRQPEPVPSDDRPVIMTALLTVISRVPLLLARGPGSEIQKPLAVVVGGGTTTSMALTLLLPARYASHEKYFDVRRNANG